MKVNKVLVGELNGCNMLSPKVRAEQVWKAFWGDRGEKIWSQNMNDAIQRYLDSNSIQPFIELAAERYASYKQSVIAKSKHAKDPKQADKAIVRECWDDWQKQPNRYKGKSEFATDMLDKFDNLKSQPVIERWCREWEKG